MDKLFITYILISYLSCKSYNLREIENFKNYHNLNHTLSFEHKYVHYLCISKINLFCYPGFF